MCSIGKENVLVYFKGDLNGYLTILQALPIDWLVGWLIDWLIDWLIGWLFDWLTDWLIDWLGDWLVGWLELFTNIRHMGKIQGDGANPKKIYFNGFVFCFV